MSTKSYTRNSVDDAGSIHASVVEDAKAERLRDKKLKSLNGLLQDGPDVQNWAEAVDAASPPSVAVDVDDNRSLISEDNMSESPLRSSRAPSTSRSQSRSSVGARSSLGTPSLLGFPKSSSKLSSSTSRLRPSSASESTLNHPLLSSLPERPPCQEQLRFGTCKYALEGCPYRHMAAHELLQFATLVGNAMPQTQSLASPPSAVSPAPLTNQAPAGPAPCRYFSLGNCTRGDNCPFLHGKPSTPSAGLRQSPRSANKLPCRFYQSGNCRNGSQCRFAHADSESYGTEQTNYQQEQEESSWQVDESTSQNGDGWGDIVVDEQGWNDNGWNANASGWDSPKSKAGYDPWAEPTSGPSQTSQNTLNTQPQREERRSPVCRLFEQGKCRFNPCRFSHEVSENTLWSSPSRRPFPEEATPNVASEPEPEPESEPAFPKDNLPESTTPDDDGNESEGSEDPWLSSDDGSDNTAKNGETSRTGPRDNKGDFNAGAAEEANLDSSYSETVNDSISPDAPDTPHIDEPTWSQSWDSSPQVAEDAEPIVKRRVPCLGFGQGYCPRGDLCEYLHIDPDTHRDHRLSEADQVDDDTIPADTLLDPVPEDTDFFGCQITFSDNTAIQGVRTSYESNCVEISGIPYGMTEAQMSDLCTPFGNIQTMGFDQPDDEEPGDTQKMWVCYTDPQIAFEAMSKLNGRELSESARLQTSLRLSTSPGITPRLAFLAGLHKPQTLKVEWPTPHISVFPYYRGITQAKAATKRLDGRIFQGRPITATFKPPKGGDPNQLVGVCIAGVHIDVADPQGEARKLMEKAVSPPDKPEAFSHLTVSPATYTGSPTPHIERLLGVTKIYGPMDVVSGSSSDIKALAFATFKSPFEAAEAANSLNNVHKSWIGKGGRLDVQPVYSRQYRLRQELREPVQRAIKQLEAQYAEEKLADAPTIKLYNDANDQDIFIVRVYGSNPVTLQRVYRDLRPCVHGNLVEPAAGESLEDAFNFSGFLQNMLHNIRDKPFTILPDLRSRKLYAYGTPAERDKATRAVQRVHQKRKENTLHAPLDQNLVAQLMRGGLDRAKDLVEEKNVVLDLITTRPGSLKVGLKDKTSAEIMREIETASAAAISAQVLDDDAEASLCALCCLQAIDPVEIDCGHQFCSGCMRHYLTSLLNLRFERLACPAGCAEDGDPCPGNVPFSIVRTVLSLQHVESLREIAFICHVASRPNEYGVCPLSGCQMAYRTCSEGTTIQCFNCQTWICAHCHEEAHEGVSCHSLDFRGWAAANDVDNAANREMSPGL